MILYHIRYHVSISETGNNIVRKYKYLGKVRRKSNKEIRRRIRIAKYTFKLLSKMLEYAKKGTLDCCVMVNHSL